jgi:hypothetical protein
MIFTCRRGQPSSTPQPSSTDRPVPVSKNTLPLARRRPFPVLLLDVSASMNRGAPRRIDVLWKAVQTLETPQVKVAVFSDGCRWTRLETTPEPDGNTNLALAFQTIRHVAVTQLTLVTDGEPNDMETAHTRGLALGVPISILFVGDPQLEEAISFCQRLCKATGGTFATEVLTLTSAPTVAKTLQRMLGTGTPPKSAIVMGGHA